MRRFEQGRLLKEVLAGEEVSGLRQATLEQGLAVLRRRRRVRQIRRMSGVGLVLVALALGLAVGWQRSDWLGRQPGVPGRPRLAAVRFITDEELMALFPSRPVALVGKPGQQLLVFLDRPASSPSLLSFPCGRNFRP